MTNESTHSPEHAIKLFNSGPQAITLHQAAVRVVEAGQHGGGLFRVDNLNPGLVDRLRWYIDGFVDKVIPTTYIGDDGTIQCNGGALVRPQDTEFEVVRHTVDDATGTKCLWMRWSPSTTEEPAERFQEKGSEPNNTLRRRLIATGAGGLLALSLSLGVGLSFKGMNEDNPAMEELGQNIFGAGGLALAAYGIVTGLQLRHELKKTDVDE